MQTLSARSVFALLALAFSASATANAPGYTLVDTLLRFDDAVKNCANRGGRLASAKELEAIYRSTLDKDGNSPLRGRHELVHVWVNEKKAVDMDLILIVPPIIGIPYPAKTPKAMVIYRYARMKGEGMYVASRRRHLDGTTAFSVCLDR